VNWSKNQTYNKFAKKQEFVDPKNCLHLTQPSVYLNANGTISACCWMNLQDTFDTIDQLPDIKTELSTMPRPICISSCGFSHV
jgi:hypothetical protein